jgi:hypothetical protein
MMGVDGVADTPLLLPFYPDKTDGIRQGKQLFGKGGNYIGRIIVLPFGERDDGY